MDEINKVPAETSEAEVTTPEVVEETVEETESEPEETVEELRERLAKAEEVANNQRIRAEKAEKVAKAKPPVTANDLNSKDLVAIMNAKVPEDDIDEVVEYAKYKKTSVSEVLKDPIMKATLDLRSEERNTAIAANTSSSRRGVNKVSDDALLSNALRGKFPEGDNDIDRLMRAKMLQNKGK